MQKQKKIKRKQLAYYGRNFFSDGTEKSAVNPAAAFVFIAQIPGK